MRRHCASPRPPAATPPGPAATDAPTSTAGSTEGEPAIEAPGPGGAEGVLSGALSLSINSPPENKVFAPNEQARVTWTIDGSGCDRFDYEFYYTVDFGRSYVRVLEPAMPDATTVAFSREERVAYVPVSPKRASVLVVASGCARWAAAETPLFEIESDRPPPPEPTWRTAR